MNSMNHACCAGVQTNAIVSIPMQQIGNFFPPQTALRNGTLYPELYKPMACTRTHAPDAESSSCQMMAFSAWEVRLYLNTHPDDLNALRVYRQLCCQQSANGSACAFVPCGSDRWSWTDDPWPWETAASGRRGQ